MRWYELNFPADLKAEPVADVLRTLAGESRGTLLAPHLPVTFETHLAQTGVRWWLAADGPTTGRLKRQAAASLPGLTWVETVAPTLALTAAVEMRIDSPDRLLDVQHTEAAVRRLLGVARELATTEVVILQWQVGSWLPRHPIAASTAPAPRTIWNLPEWGAPRADSEQVQTARRKQTEPVFAVAGRIAVAGASGRRADQLMAATGQGYQLLRAPGVGPSFRLLPSTVVRRRLRSPSVSRLNPAIRLTAPELAAVIGWPIGNPGLPGVRYDRAPKLPLDQRSLVSTPSAPTRVVGAASFPAQSEQVAVLRPTDALRHLHIVGPTGSGKSVLMARLILSDIAAGRTVVVIDPKGDLCTDVLARLPDGQRDRVALLDPTDSSPAGFNPLDDPQGVDGLLHVLHSLWANSWGPRLGDLLFCALSTLARSPGHTLAELPLLLMDAAFRRPLVARAVAADPLGLGTFWPWYEGLSDDARAQALAPVMNKIRAFLLRPELRAVLGQAQPKLNLAAVMRGRMSLLVRLPKGQLGEGTALLGSLLVSHLWRLGLSRAALASERRRPTYFYLDEFQDFLRLPLDLADVLVQARGLKIGVAMAHQHFGQLDAATKAAIVANAHSRVAFRLDHDDATFLARRTGGQITAEALSSLGAYEAYASLLVDGEATPYGSIQTLPLNDADQPIGPLLRANRQRWGVPATDTETRLRRLVEGSPEAAAPSPPIGGRRRLPPGAPT